MPWTKRAKPSPAIIVAVVALVAALGSSAVAGVTISKLNNKEKKQVKKISKRQAKKAVKGIPAGPQGNTGPQGPKGETGPQGPKGDPAGTSAVARFQTSEFVPTPPNGLAQATSLCEAGEVAVGGGGSFVLGTDAVSDQMSFSVPTGPGGSPVADGEAPVGWRAKGKNTSGANLTWRTYVLCVEGKPTGGG